MRPGTVGVGIKFLVIFLKFLRFKMNIVYVTLMIIINFLNANVHN